MSMDREYQDRIIALEGEVRRLKETLTAFMECYNEHWHSLAGDISVPPRKCKFKEEAKS